MGFSVRRLGMRDEAILNLLAAEDADFDIADRGRPRTLLSTEAAQAYLSDPNVLHWIAEAPGVIMGHMYCHVLRRRAGDSTELLLYEIGVRSGYRRKKIGKALVDAMYAWMKEHQVQESWVLADNPGAVEFYRACGFHSGEPAPLYMTAAATTRA